MIRFTRKIRFMPLLAIVIAGALLCSSCGVRSEGAVEADTGNNAGADEPKETVLQTGFAVFDEADTDESWSETDAVFITLSGDSVSVTGGGGAIADGTTVTIVMGGTYVLSGTLNDGQVIVYTKDTAPVRLILNDADITCTNGAPIYVKSAKKTVLVLADKTENSVTDGATYMPEDAESGEPNAAIFSKDDLTINGTGTMTVHANYKNGISSKDGLKIVSGTVLINAVGDGLRGRDYVAIRGGDVEITAGTDGIKSSNDEHPGVGFVRIEAGTITIRSGSDAIQAETVLAVNGGDLTLVAGGGSAAAAEQSPAEFGGQPPADIPVGAGAQPHMAAPGQPAEHAEGTPSLPSAVPEDASADDAEASEGGKGLKAGTLLAIHGGTISVDASDDALHSDGKITIHGGTIRLSSGDDGLHSDGAITVSGGEITVIKSVEGMEGASITISDGTIRITSEDDGINIAGGNDSSAAGGRFGADRFTVTDGNTLQIDGGYIVIDAAGDGIDVNGSAYMTGGTVLVSGPTNSGNGALDYNGEFQIIGGYLIAAGSSRMAQSPSAEISTQYTVTVTFDTEMPGGTMVALLDESGECVLAFTPSKRYQTVVISAPEFMPDGTYTVWYGGSATGWETDGMYMGADYTPGTEFATVTLAAMVTTAGTVAPERGDPMGGGNARG